MTDNGTYGDHQATIQPWSTVEGWVWCGTAGHLIVAASCRMHLHTRVGDYRISTVGEYYPQGSDMPETVGLNRLYETMVFRVAGFGEHGEGEVIDWSEVDMAGYNDLVAAERGHMRMCLKYDQIARAESDGS